MCEHRRPRAAFAMADPRADPPTPEGRPMSDVATPEITMPDLPIAYRGIRERVSTLIREASPEQLDAIAPATPEWRVHDVLAHVVGVTTDIIESRLDGVATDAWTQAQVDRRRSTPTVELIDEWAANAPTVEPMIPSFGTTAGQMVADAVTHEHDIRHALGRTGARDSDAVHAASAWLAQWMGASHLGADRGALRIDTDLWTHTWGGGEPTTVLRTSAFELLRAATGRRSADQIDALDWDGTPHPEMVVLAIFVARGEDFDG